MQLESAMDIISRFDIQDNIHLHLQDGTLVLRYCACLTPYVLFGRGYDRPVKSFPLTPLNTRALVRFGLQHLISPFRRHL